MYFCELEYLSIGGNRQSAAADCSSGSGLVAFGADLNVALWQPQDPSQRGIKALLKGHSDKVTAVRFLTSENPDCDTLVSGSADGEIKLWRGLKEDYSPTLSSSVKGHDGAVNIVSFLSGSPIFATGSADASVKIWRVGDDKVVPLHAIRLKPRYIPLALVFGAFPDNDGSDSFFLIVGGTKADVQVYAITDLLTEPRHALQATLSGHEGWIRSLSLLAIKDEFLLASASHDKYVRIWRIKQMHQKRKHSGIGGEEKTEKTLTRKVQTIQLSDSIYTIIFEALLLGHEDWVYSAAWSLVKGAQNLLTASADGTLAIWEPDPDSGIWVSKSRLGEISGQKGATTATGSAGGFWVGMWSPSGQDIMCLDRTGSWRRWQYESASDYWASRPGVSGHTASANGISWSQDGAYLLSTGSDQTTRLHAEWKHGQKRTWHEFARPQIHGYDLNCITSVSPQRFVSGADEKLLRVFDEPKNVASMLARLCGVTQDHETDLPDAASMPVLGLSNKASEIQTEPDGQDDDEDAARHSKHDPEVITIALESNEPPTEELLARHTLWPEHEKLYGHGYEISEAASNADGTILATACKASSTDHAVIRLYNTDNWHEIKPPLVAHSLTVTRLAFSSHTQPSLLSVGRDRQWTVFEQSKDSQQWNIFQAFPKAHSRMILDAAWSPVGEHRYFATAGRDKVVKLWRLLDAEPAQRFALAEIITRRSAVTAISFTSSQDDKLACLAVGEEEGLMSLHVFAVDHGLSLLKSWDMDPIHCLAKAVNRIQWRPGDMKEAGTQLAIGAADGSIRILRVDWISDYRSR